MKILLVPLLLAVSLPAFAEVDPKIHKLCIEAKDYAGCVRAMKGDTMPSTRVINSHKVLTSPKGISVLLAGRT